MRTLAVLAALAGGAAFVAAVVSDGSAGRAAFVLGNGNEPESLDPALAGGAPEQRVARALFEGLVVLDPVTAAPVPGAARTFTQSADGLAWTFELQPRGKWSDGTPVVAEDFVFSLLRVLHPATGSRSANILFDVRGARAFSRAASDAERDPRDVGIRAAGPRTLVIELERRSPSFLHVLALPAFAPVSRAAIERAGVAWTRPRNLVSNGPFRLASRVVRDRLRLVRNEHYWDAAAVALPSLDVLCATSLNTLVNLFVAGEVDWITDVPASLVATLRSTRPDALRTAPMLGTYFYRVNVRHETLGNTKVRAALSLALDRDAIARTVLQGGEAPASGLVPPQVDGHPPARALRHDPERARVLLAEGLREAGRSALPPFELLYNAHELHEAIAEMVQAQWREHLGVTCRLARQDWAAARASIARLDYSVARGSWIFDTPDPTSVLDVFTSGSANNQTGFSDARYDRLVERDARATAGAERAAILAEAERILLDAHAVIPIFHYVSYNLVAPFCEGFSTNPLDVHFPKFLRTRAP